MTTTVTPFVRNEITSTEARGFALYVGIDEATAEANGTSLGAIVAALRNTLDSIAPGLAAETFASVALAKTGSGGRNVDVVRAALSDPKALERLVDKTEEDPAKGVVVDLQRRKVFIDGDKADLTSKEFCVLEYLVRHQGITISREELITTLWNCGGGQDIYGCTVVEPAVVLATHLDHLIREHSSELLGRQETQDLLDHFKMSYPKLIEDVIPKVVSVANLQRILQMLLDEDVPIKDLRTIIEVASEHPDKLSNPIEVMPFIRYALRRTIVQETLGEGPSFQVLGIQPEFERLIEQSIGAGAVAPDGVIEPSLARLFGEEVIKGVQEMEANNLPPVIVSGTRTRMTFAKIAKRVCPQAIVLALGELPPSANLSFYRVICSQAGQTN